ncbi:AbrB/MazE/SpoVT family DNA-binding domain-containing protein [Halobellus rubicundus]|uniref:AbrB/MazE/SpoVT family DNA-binding domain-containing protein n=1 Tax=Halobellus rubicundus TaxID=2996466 RepID=A0ABD5M7P6_9EURY
MSSDDLRMKRKIQKLGSSTLAVTLPAEWAREQGLEKGDELVVQRDESSGSLLVVPDTPAETEATATIDVASLDPESVRRAILAQYVLGRQLIEVESDGPIGPPIFEAITETERRLMGLGVVEEGIDTVAIRCSVDPGDFELPTLMDRLWRTEATMRSEAVEALLSSDTDLAERAIGRQRQVEKLFYLFLRLVFTTYRNPRLNESVGLETGFPLIGYRSVAQDVVLMAGAARDLADDVIDAGGVALDAETQELLTEVATALEDAATATRQAVTNPTTTATSEGREALATFASHADRAQEHLESARPEPLLALQRILLALRRSADHAEDSLDVATHFAFHSTGAVETNGV